jgi:5-(carboxyamino)imidazole ribonucleotide mutase
MHETAANERKERATVSREIHVAVLMGSESDREVMETCLKQLEKLGIPCELEVYSAHRMPDETRTYVERALERGARVFIAGAGMSAALPGFVAACTTRPVIGVPIASGMPDGIDALLAMSQMPSGVPVATVSVGKAGAKNAAILAAEILSITDDDLVKRLLEMREEWKRR